MDEQRAQIMAEEVERRTGRRERLDGHETVKQSGKIPVHNGHARTAQSVRVLDPLTVQGIQTGGGDYCGRQACMRISPVWVNQVGRVESRFTTQVLPPVPLHRCAGIEVAGAVAAVAVRVER